MIRPVLATAAFCLLAAPAAAQDAATLLQQLDAALTEAETALVAEEQVPPPEGSERAAQIRLDALRAELANAGAARSATDAETARLLGRIEALLATALGPTVAEPVPTQPPTLPEPPAQGAEPAPAPGTTAGGEGSDPGGTTVATTDVPGADPAPSDTVAGPGIELPLGGGTAEAPDQVAPTPTPGPIISTSGGPLQENGLAQRVLTLPEAGIYPSPDSAQAATAVATFSIFYVFERRDVGGQPWLLVGASETQPQGWMQAARTEDWRSMLVMQYAPKSDRGRVVFFSQPDHIQSLIDDAFGVEDTVAQLYASIADGSYDNTRVVSIEPSLAVAADERPYLMPVLSHQRGVFDLDGTVTQLLELAAVNTAETRRDPAANPTGDINTDQVSTTGTVRDLKIGIAFVIDTTQSMGPYMREAQDFVTGLVRELERDNTGANFDFGLVGYRDNLSGNAGIGYVTQTFRDFGQSGDIARFEQDVRAMQPATVSTTNWREDAFAGLEDAINGLNWSAVDNRLVFLITDAGPRSLNDALARDGRLGPASIAAMTGDRNMSLFIMHMKTDRARTVSQQTDGIDDVRRGEELYTQLQAAANDTSIRYFGVSGDSEGNFGVTLRSTRDAMVNILRDMSRGEAIQTQDVDSAMNPDSPDFDADLYMLGSPLGVTEIDTPERAELVTGAIVSELFRQQQDYLGAKSGVEAPAFYRAWAADRDLVDPTRRALEVSVFLTRNQLSDLAKRLDDVVTAMENKEAGMGDFFAEVQERSGRASVDPTLKEFLPEFLLDLPYSTRFQILTEREWSAMGDLQQLEMIASVKDKSEAYKRINASAENWYSLNRDTSGEQVYPLPLSLLP